MKKRTVSALFAAIALSAGVALFAASCGGTAQTATTATSVATTAVSSATETTAASGTATSAAVAQSGTIVVSGLVDYPMSFTSVDMDYMDWVTVTQSGTAYEGVHLSDIWTFYGVQSTAKTVTVTAADGSKTQVTLADISSDSILAVGDDQSFTLVMPGMTAAELVQGVTAMDFE